jgi:hypothetical protein
MFGAHQDAHPILLPLFFRFIMPNLIITFITYNAWLWVARPMWRGKWPLRRIPSRGYSAQITGWPLLALRVAAVLTVPAAFVTVVLMVVYVFLPQVPTG